MNEYLLKRYTEEGLLSIDKLNFDTFYKAIVHAKKWMRLNPDLIKVTIVDENYVVHFERIK